METFPAAQLRCEVIERRSLDPTLGYVATPKSCEKAVENFTILRVENEEF